MTRGLTPPAAPRAWAEGAHEASPGDLLAAVRDAAGSAGLGLIVSEQRGDEVHNLFVNDMAVALLGYPREELLSRPPFSDIAPDERPRMQARRDARLRGESLSPRFETVVEQKDGTRVPISVAVGFVSIAGRSVWVSFFSDLRDERDAERRMARADRLATLGTLAAGLAHELSNPLAFARMQIEVLGRETATLGADPLRRARIEATISDVRTGIDRASTIVRDIKTFSRFDHDVVGSVDLLDALDTAERLAAPTIRALARVVRDVEPVPRVRSGQGRLEQVLVNLLVNAAQALSPGRAENEIRVRVRARDSWVVLEVSDDGAGIEPEHLARVFDPFFTTKPAGEGTGLGLAVCQSIVSRAGGDISVHSEPGRGTRVVVRLRPADATAGETTPSGTSCAA